jgi:hypothetical protein
MDKNLLLGIWRYLLPVPPAIWRKQVGGSHDSGPNLAFMSDDHHRVRDFVVVELPRAGQPLSPQLIASSLELPLERVQTILDELERHKTFLFRNPQGDVAWAYPVTVDVTPHQVSFNSGEQVYAA